MKNNILLTATLLFLLLGYASSSIAAQKSDSVNATIASKTTKPVITSHSFTGINSRLIGRFDQSSTGQAKFTWPGSAIEFRFEGTQASINMTSQNSVRFLVNVDGKQQELWTQTGNHNYPLTTTLANGTHLVRLTRLNESTAGITSFISDPQVDGKLLVVQTPQKRLLIIGDSITAGYGVEGADQNCHYTLDTSNQQLTYAALAANALGADLHAIAWSGIGAWRSYGEKTPVNPSILIRYPRALADDATSVWDAAQYVPDAILINIGTNDYWEGSVTDEYRASMAALIAKVKSDYSNKPIYLIVSPMLTNKLHEAQKQVLSSFAKDNIKVFDLGENTGSEGFGCDYHPNIRSHKRLGAALQKSLEAELHW